MPPKPSGVTFDEKRKGDDAPSTKITQTVKWAAPRSEGVEIRVYGVTECIAKPANPSPDTHGPCLVEHTPLPASVRKLLATAPASDGVVSWTWTGTFDCEDLAGIRPSRAGVPRRRACCLQHVRQLDLCHRRAWQMVATRS